jgi:hypothetical protein
LDLEHEEPHASNVGVDSQTLNADCQPVSRFQKFMNKFSSDETVSEDLDPALADNVNSFFPEGLVGRQVGRDN